MIREQIRSTPEYQEIEGSQDQQVQQTQQKTVGDSLAPVLSWEKGDVEFWLQVAQLVALLLILRELQGGG